MLNIINTTSVPAPNGHYSQAVEANGFIFTSVQLGVSPKKPDASVSDELKTILYNIEQILLASESKLSKVVKITIYLSDITDWAIVDKVIEEFFGAHKPARGIIPVGDLHLGAKVGAEVVAIK